MDKYEIISKIEQLENEEKRLCERYCELNPDDRKQREHDRDLILFAYWRVKTIL